MEKVYPTTEQVKKFLYKYVPNNKQDRKGLFLLPAQTGSGKTHATIQYMAEKIKSGSKENMIYIVNIIKSVKETYHKLLDELDTTEEQSKVLWLKSNHESVFDFFKNNTNIDDFTHLNRFNEFKKLKESVLFAIKHNSIEDEITKEIVSKLNRTLQDALIKYYKDNKLDGFRNEVGLLYPTVKLKEYNAIFMTTKKFFFSVFDLDGRYTIYSDSKFGGSTLFIDEFDTQKKIILSTIIEQENRYKYDMFDIVISIENALRSKDYVKKYNVDKEAIDNILEFYNKIFYKYKIARGFKYEFEEEETINTMLMDSSGATFINSRGSRMKASCLDNSTTNSVGLKGDIDFVDIVRDVTTALKRYIGLCKRIVADRTISIIDTVKKDEIKEAIIYDLIKEIGTSSGDIHYKYLSDTIRNELFQSKQAISTSRDNLYENGFNIIDVKQKSMESVTTDFELILLSNTPENFLKKTCKHMFVVAVSATCTLNTVIRNFDLKYLSKELQDKYKTLSKDEIKSMNSLYIQAKKQKDRDITIKYIEPIYNDDYGISRKYFNSNESFHSEYINPLKKQKSEYYFKQYERILHCYMDFLLYDEIEAFMHLQSNFPRNGLDDSKNYIYTKTILILIFEMMVSNKFKLSRTIQIKIDRLEEKRKELGDERFYKYIEDENELIYFYNSQKENQTAYNKVLGKKLEDGDKIYLMSSYATIGSGVNMEYVAKDGMKKDFDAIFMDKTSSLITRFYDSPAKTSKDKSNEKMTALYELESLYIKGFYTASRYMRIAKLILKHSIETEMKYPDTNDYVNSSMGILIQAIGRLYRTDDISKMYIYLSDDLRDVVSNFDSSNISLLPAVQQLIEKTTEGLTIDDKLSSESSRIKKAIEQSKNIFKSKNYSIYRYIQYMLAIFNGSDINESHIADWETKRLYLISNPTIDSESSIHEEYYGKVPIYSNSEYSYYYSQEDDYKSIEIDFKSKKGNIEVSSESAMLDVIAKTKELQECVINNKIALKFKHQYIMTPIVFNNLYKGAMGEVLGKYILDKYCDVELESLGVHNDEYERFDYKTINNIYIDFKYYSQSTLETKEIDEINRLARKKMETMRGCKAIIINIFADSTDKSKYIDANVDVVIVPFLIDIKQRDKPMFSQNAIEIIRKICHGA